MEYLVIDLWKMEAAEFLGSDPTERSTWFSLLRYCARQENGGTILDCKVWKDRQWQMVCGVTFKEVKQPCRLFWWEGNDLRIWEYPADREDELRAKRRGGQVGGKRSGEVRSSKQGAGAAPTEQDGSTASSIASKDNGSSASSIASSSARSTPLSISEGPRERIGLDGNGSDRIGLDRSGTEGSFRPEPAVKKHPDRKPVPLPAGYLVQFPPLLTRILELTEEPDDPSTRGLYGKYYRDWGMHVLEKAISTTNGRKLDRSQPPLDSVAAYFNQTCKNLGAEQQSRATA